MNRRRIHSPDDHHNGPPHKQQSPGPETDKNLNPEPSKNQGSGLGTLHVDSIFPSDMLKNVDEYKEHFNGIESIESDEEAFQTAAEILVPRFSSTPRDTDDKKEPGRNTPVQDEIPFDDKLEAEVWNSVPRAEETQQRISQLDQAPASSTLPINLSSVDPAVAEMIILNTGKPLMDDSSVNVTPFLADESINRERPSDRESKKREKMKLIMDLKQNHISQIDREIAILKSQKEAFIQNNPAEVRAEFSQHIKRKARIHEQLSKRAIDKDINNAYREIKAKKKLKKKMMGKRATMEAIMDVFEFVEEMSDDESNEDTEHDYEEIKHNPSDEVLSEGKNPPDPVVDANKKAEAEMRASEINDQGSLGALELVDGAAGGGPGDVLEPGV